MFLKGSALSAVLIFIRREIMTIEEVLAEVDEIKPNTFDDNIKLKWLSELDGKIYKELILTHEHDADITFTPYTSADMNKELLAEFPYSDIYRHYVFANIDYSNGESDRYQNSMVMFNNAFDAYRKYYNKTYKPIQNILKVF